MTPPRRLVLFAALAAAASATRAATDAEALFVRRVAPLLREKCLACHGQDEAKLKGGLDLRTRADAVPPVAHAQDRVAPPEEFHGAGEGLFVRVCA